MPSGTKLKDLIRKIRACKTLQEERDVVQKECALIRTSFKEEDSETRSRNVAKLLYIHILGYPAHFGQLECLKLIASPKYTDKRVGYLGAMMLLDERQDVHVLITNSMKNDLKHQVQYVQSLSLSALGTIASQEMARDLAQEVEGLLKGSNPYIKKKAALCAVRIIRKVPELMEMFVPLTRSLLLEKNHGVLVGAATLMEEMCRANPDSIPHLRKFVPNLVRIVKGLIQSNHSPEHDVSGVCDPFLQVQLVRLFRVLAQGDRESSEQLNDVLAQIATNTDSHKNAGHAVLYETVRAIMTINSESGLRVLGVNILGRFLLSHDRNIRYTALNTLLYTVKVDYTAVQRHRATVLDCLKENDVSIRRRALELSLALVNESNVRVMVQELLAFLRTDTDVEFKPYLASNLILAANKYAPDKQWQLDTVLDVLISAGSYVRDDLVAGIVRLISSTPELQGYSAQRLYGAVGRDDGQQALVQVCVWCLGEFADQLVSGQVEGEEPIQVEEREVVGLMEQLLRSPRTSPVTKDYIINALMKLTARLSPAVSPQLLTIIKRYRTSIDAEIQQRAVEYLVISEKYSSMKTGLLEKMPPMAVEGEAEPAKESPAQVTPPGRVVHVPTQQQPLLKEPQGDTLLDLLGDNIPMAPPPSSEPSQLPESGGPELLELLGGGPTTAAPASITQSSAAGEASLFDLLGTDMTPSSSQQADTEPAIQLPIGDGSDPNTIKTSISFALLDLHSSAPPYQSADRPPSQGPVQPSSMERACEEQISMAIHHSTASLAGQLTDKRPIPTMTAFEGKGLHVVFSFSKKPAEPNQCTVTLTASNSTPHTMSDFLFQAAVPKVFQMQMLPPSGTSVPSGSSGRITQDIRISNLDKQPLRMRIRISYRVNGVETLEQGEINSFPEQLLQ